MSTRRQLLSRKLSALFTALAIIANTSPVRPSFAQLPHNPPYLNAHVLTPNPTIRIDFPFTLPPDLLRVDRQHSSDGPLSVLLIQDAHAHKEIQGQIARIIRYVTSTGDIILTEGTPGRYVLDYFRRFPDVGARDTVLRELLEESKISGAEYAAMTHDEAVHLEGIDNESLYLKNLKLFHRSAGERNAVLLFTRKIRSALRTAGQRLMSTKLRDFLSEDRRFSENLSRIAGRIGFYVSMAERYELSLDKWPTVYRLNALLTNTARASNPEDSEDSATLIEDEMRSISTGRLWQDLDVMRLSIVDRMDPSAPERKLIFLERYLELAERAAELRLTRADRDALTKMQSETDGAMRAQWLEEIGAVGESKSAFAEIEKNLPGLLAFYDTAGERDRHMVRNIERSLRRWHRRRAVVIIGGFHHDGIIRELEKRRISYVSVTPLPADSAGLQKEQTYRDIYRERLSETAGLFPFQRGSGHVIPLSSVQPSVVDNLFTIRKLYTEAGNRFLKRALARRSISDIIDRWSKRTPGIFLAVDRVPLLNHRVSLIYLNAHLAGPIYLTPFDGSGFGNSAPDDNSESDEIDGTVGKISVHWNWNLDSEVVVIRAHDLGQTASDMDHIFAASLGQSASVVRYKSSRKAERRALPATMDSDELSRMFGNKTFTDASGDLDRVIRETILRYRSDASSHKSEDPKIILLGKGHGGQIISEVAGKFAEVKHVVLIRTPLEPVELRGSQRNQPHPLTLISPDAGRKLALFSGSVDIVLWQGDRPVTVNQSVRRWMEFLKDPHRHELHEIGNGGFEQPTGIRALNQLLNQRIQEVQAGFGTTLDHPGEDRALIASVEDAMVRWFGPNPEENNLEALIAFLADYGEAAIDIFVSAIETDRSNSIGPYKIPPYTYYDPLPDPGTISEGPDGVSYSLPYERAELEDMRLDLMARIAVQRALGRDVAVHVGSGHVAQSAIALEQSATKNFPSDSNTTGRRFRGTLSGKNVPYFSVAYQRPSPSSGYTVRYINDGRPPRGTSDTTIKYLFSEGRAAGTLAATFLPEVMAVADLILVETEFDLQIPGGTGIGESRVDREPMLELLKTAAALAKRDALIVIESTVQPGFVRHDVVPTLSAIFKKRFDDWTDDRLMLAYAPQRLITGAQEVESLRKLRREAIAPSAHAAALLETYFKTIGLRYALWDQSEEVEYLKLLETAWFLDLLEILDGHLKAMEKIGVDAFKVIESIARARRDRGAMRHVPSMCPGGSCSPEALAKLVDGLRTFFGTDPLRIQQVFQSRYVASSILQRRAEAVGWKLLSFFSERAAVPFSEIYVGLLGIGYKEGSGSTRHSGSERAVRHLIHLGAHVEATDPHASFWPELRLQEPHSATSEARSLENQESVYGIKVEQHEDPLDFLQPRMDALVFATRHLSYVGKYQPGYKRRTHRITGKSAEYAGIDPVKIAARMLGIEGKVIVDTHDFFSDKDYRLLMSLGWRIEAFGKGHLYGGAEPLVNQITPEERIDAVKQLVPELRALSDRPGFRQEDVDLAVTIAEAKLTYLLSIQQESSDPLDVALNRTAYEELKSELAARFLTNERRKLEIARAKVADAEHQMLLASAGKTSSHATVRYDALRNELDTLTQARKNKTTRYLNEHIVSPGMDMFSTALTHQGQLAQALGNLIDAGSSYLTSTGTVDVASLLWDLVRGPLAQNQRLLETIFRSSIIKPEGRRRIAEDVRARTSRPELRIVEARPRRIPVWARKVARQEGFRGTFRIAHEYFRNARGKLARAVDPARHSNRPTVKWVGDMQKGKRALPGQWSKFTVEVPLFLVPVEDLHVEAFGDFMNLPWEFRDWLMRDVWGKGYILTTLQGKKGIEQHRVRLLMEVNLDPKTLARGRGGMLFWGDTGEPIIVTSDLGAEFVTELKAAGPYTGGNPDALKAKAGRVVQGGAGEKRGGQRIVTRTDLGAMFPGHQAGGEDEAINLLRLEGTRPYTLGQTPRAIFRIRFRYPGNPQEFEMLGRASPTNVRTGHVFKASSGDFDPSRTARIMGANAAEILTHHVTGVHIALSPDNTLATGYYTDAGSIIDLFNERDPFGAFQKYFGYYIQLVVYSFNDARAFEDESRPPPTPDIKYLQDWLNAFFDRFLNSDLVYNKAFFLTAMDRFRHIYDAQRLSYPFFYEDVRGQRHTSGAAITEAVMDDLMALLWDHYLPYHLLRNRLERGFDPTRESIYSTVAERRYDPSDKEKARKFLENERVLLMTADRQIREEGFPRLSRLDTPFDFRKAEQTVGRLMADLDVMEETAGDFASPTRYSGAFQLSHYPSPRPEVFALLDLRHYLSSAGDTPISWIQGQFVSSGLKSKYPAAFLREVEPALQRIRYFIRKERVDFGSERALASLVRAYFTSWASLDKMALEIGDLKHPWDVLIQMQQDFLSAGAHAAAFPQLRKVTAQSSFRRGDYFYAHLTYNDEDVFLKARFQNPDNRIAPMDARDAVLIDRAAFQKASTNQIGSSPHPDASDEMGFGHRPAVESWLSDEIGEHPSPSLPILGQLSTDRIVEQIDRLFTPGDAGRKRGVLVIDHEAFARRLSQIGTVSEQLLDVVLNISSVKKVVLVGLGKLDDGDRRALASLFGIPAGAIVSFNDPAQFNPQTLHGEPLIAALDGRHKTLVSAVLEYEREFPHAVLLLAGENFSFKDDRKFKHMRVVSLMRVEKALGDLMATAMLFRKSA